MSLDTETLFTIASCITGLLGVFLLLVWVQERAVRALAWWGVAYLLGGSGVALWGAQSTLPFITPEMPNALLFTACGMIWNGARLFHGRPALPGALFGGAIVWLIVTAVFDLSEPARVVLSSLVIATYAVLTAYELRRERRRSLIRRWLSFGVPLLHGVVFLSPIPLILTASGTNADGWFVLFALEILLYVVGTAFIVVVMANERVALVHKTAALTDTLTGLPNRRAVLEAADRLIAQQARKGGMVSALLFDLDRFKSINDRFGHATGDEILRVFGKTVSDNMRADDVYGRFGGEEFAVVLASPPHEAAAVGERLRLAFQIAGVEVAGHQLNATVSIGVASGVAPLSIEDLFAIADTALYRAKENGRNRVEIARGAVGAPDRAGAPSSAEPVLALS